MREIVIERWQGLDGTVAYRWSLWADGRRLQMGGPHGDAEASLADAQSFCRAQFECEAERVTRL
jgi:hypothetical protein